MKKKREKTYTHFTKFDVRLGVYVAVNLPRPSTAIDWSLYQSNRQARSGLPISHRRSV